MPRQHTGMLPPPPAPPPTVAIAITQPAHPPTRPAHLSEGWLELWVILELLEQGHHVTAVLRGRQGSRRSRRRQGSGGQAGREGSRGMQGAGHVGMRAGASSNSAAGKGLAALPEDRSSSSSPAQQAQSSAQQTGTAQLSAACPARTWSGYVTSGGFMRLSGMKETRPHLPRLSSAVRRSATSSFSTCSSAG